MDGVTMAVSHYAKSKGISVKCIADNTGISYSILQPSFSGKRKLRANEFMSVCEFLAVDPKEFAPHNQSTNNAS